MNAALDRWQREASSPMSSWRERLSTMAGLVREGESVLDVGAGSRELFTLLPLGCKYIPLDRVAADGVVPIDLDAERPVPAKADVAVVSGVLEYLDRPASALRRIAEAAPRIILSYNHPERGSGVGRDWRNAMSQAELLAILDSLNLRARIVCDNSGECIYEVAR